MDLQEMINHIAAGDSVAAKESIENVLSAKAFNALQSRKQEIASTLFGGQNQESEEITEDEETVEEGWKGAAVGGALGAVGGPVGAAVGGALGHATGEALSSLRKRTVQAGKAFATKPQSD